MTYPIPATPSRVRSARRPTRPSPQQVTIRVIRPERAPLLREARRPMRRASRGRRPVQAWTVAGGPANAD